MAITVSELQVRVSADTKDAESGLAALGSKIGSAGGMLASAFGGAALAGIAGLTAGLGASVAAAAGFEAQMSSVSAVSGATAAEMDALKAAALDLGAKTSFSASEAGKGIEELVKAGVSIGDVLGGAAAASLSLAAAGAISVGDAAEIAANAMNQFGLKGTDLAGVADLIAGAANASAIDVNDFKFSLAAVGAVANTVGFSFGDTATAIALLGQAGIKGSDAGTSLKTMLLNLQPATKEQTSLFRELGLITADGSNKFFDAQGKVKGMAEVAGTLQTALAGMTQQQKLAALEVIFGSDAIRAAAVFANEGATGFNEMAASMGKVTAEAVAAERLNNLKGDIEQLTGSLETAGIKIGTAFLPGLRSIVSGSTEMVNQAAPMLEQFATGAAADIQEASRQIGDAWRTARQAFEGKWLPSDDIPPFVNAVGTAATAAGKLAEFLGKVADKARDMGAIETFATLVQRIGETAAKAGQSGEKLAESIGRIGGSSQSANDKVTPLALAIKTIGTAADLVVLNIGFLIDTTTTLVRIFAGSVAAIIGASKTLAGTLTGDMALAREGALQFIEASTDMVSAAQEWKANTGAAFSAGMADIKSLVGSGSQAAAAEQERGTARMATVTQDNMLLVAANTELGMTGAVSAVETQAPVAVATAEAMGTGMAAGIEAATPAMVAAAEQGATGAVAAVQGQQGAASGAGQAVGDSLGSGMQSGILAWAGRIASAAASLVSNAIAAARGPEGADAHSPSKKTEKLGEDMAEGIEVGLAKSKLGTEMKARILDFIQASRDYIPVAGEIRRVENEIKDIRDRGQTEALFRAERMITVDSEALRLKQAQVSLERDLLPLRQDIARATREISDIERGNLADRTRGLELGKATAEQNIRINQLEKDKIPLRARELEIERLLLSEDPAGKRAKALKEEQDEIRKKSGLIDNTIAQIRLQTRTEELDMATLKERATVDATATRIRLEGLTDQQRGQQTVIDLIRDQIEVLGAEQAVFQANENVIKNATDNEIAYRNRLIAVFTAEGKPLADRITAGLGLIEQLEKEGKVSKELADKLRDVAKEAGIGSEKTAALGNSAATAAPQMDTASKKAEEMAKQAKAVADQAKEGSKQVDALSSSLGKVPDFGSWTNTKGGSLFKFGGERANGGPVTAGTSYLVGERGIPEVFTPRTSGVITPIMPAVTRGGDGDTYVIDARGAVVYDGSKFEDMLARSLEKMHRGGKVIKVTR